MNIHRIELAFLGVLTMGGAAIADDLVLDNQTIDLAGGSQYGSVELKNGASATISSGTVSVSPTYFKLGYDTGTGGNVIRVNGETAVLSFGSSKFSAELGPNGNENVLSIGAGGQLLAPNVSFELGNHQGRDATLGHLNQFLLFGEGSRAEVASVVLSRNGCDNLLQVRDGASLTVGTSVTCSSDDRQGTGNRMSVENATVSFTRAKGNNVFAFAAANEGGGLTVSGETAVVEMTAGFKLSNGASASLEDGATLSVGGQLYLGMAQGGNAHLSIAGGSTLTASDAFAIGNAGADNEATITDGGKLSFTGTWAYVGYGEGANGNRLLVAGEGSSAEFTCFQVGISGQNGVVIVSNKASLVANEYDNGYGSTSFVSTGNRLEVLDGATVDVAVFNKEAKGANGNILRVKDASFKSDTFNWNRGTIVRLEGSSSKLVWETSGKGVGSPLDGVLEFVPPPDPFTEPPIDLKVWRDRPDSVFNLSYDESKPFTVRIVDAEACMKAGGGRFPLVRSTIALGGELDKVILDAPEGTELTLENEGRELWVKVPRKKSGLILIVR